MEISDEEMALRKAQWEREAREPSPLPWSGRPHKEMVEDDEEPIEIVDANGYTVADNVRFYSHRPKVADLKFIVARVNAHDALVAALKESKFALETLNIRNGQCGWLIAKIDDALALAGIGN